MITVPIKILQNRSISFVPNLPAKRLELIQKVKVWGGFKAFFEFSEKFYPAAIGFNSISDKQGHKLFYDASYGQNTDHNVLGVFAVGPVSKKYTKLKGDDLKAHILNELDELFNNKVSSKYIKHISQNWTDAPYAKGAYVHYLENWNTIRKLAKPIDNKLFFAGDAYTDGSEWSSVHAAVHSTRKAIKNIIG